MRKLQTSTTCWPFRSSVAFDGWEQTLRNARATLNTL